MMLFKYIYIFFNYDLWLTSKMQGYGGKIIYLYDFYSHNNGGWLKSFPMDDGEIYIYMYCTHIHIYIYTYIHTHSQWWLRLLCITRHEWIKMYLWLMCCFCRFYYFMITLWTTIQFCEYFISVDPQVFCGVAARRLRNVTGTTTSLDQGYLA